MKTLDLRYTLNRTMEPFDSIEHASLDGLLERVKNSKVVLLGEETHGTAEFYSMRAKITQTLIEKLGFNIVAVEADWPDAASVNRYIKNKADHMGEQSFTRFPFWMWRNVQMQKFIDWLKSYNSDKSSRSQVSFYGLDLYSLYSSIEAVLKYLEEIDPQAAAIARQRYGCLAPWDNPTAYGASVLTGGENCESKVVAMLKELLEKQAQYGPQDESRFFDAICNAQVIADAEQYYRMMYYGTQ
jgi:erythromycin esterase-like protein